MNILIFLINKKIIFKIHFDSKMLYIIINNEFNLEYFKSLIIKTKILLLLNSVFFY